MLNTATVIVGISVAVILMLAVYSVIRNSRKGGCVGCNECCCGCKNGRYEHDEREKD
ncbi:MAG: FeoB-associated Cys-rich membrane protein [Candidatus Methanomethylophilaceae archaeon]